MFKDLRALYLGAIFVIAPFVFSAFGHDSVRVIKLKSVVLFGAAYFSFWLFKRIGLGLASFFLVSAFSNIYIGFGLNQAYNMVFITFAFFLCGASGNLSKIQLRHVLIAISVSGVLCSFYGYLQMTGIDPIIRYKQGSSPLLPGALFGQHTLFGPWAVACFLASIHLRWWIIALFILPPIFATGSALTLLALVGSCFIYGSKFVHPKVTIAGVIVVLIGLAIGLSLLSGKDKYFSGNGRYEVWQGTLEMAKEKPLLGHGMGTFRYLFHKHKQSKDSLGLHGRFLQAHNEYLEVFFELGIIGLFSLLLVLYDFIKGLVRKKDMETWAFASIAVGFALNSIGNFPFQVMPQALLALFSIMVVTRKVDNEHEQTGRLIYT